MKKLFQYLIALLLIFAGITGFINVIYMSYLIIEGQIWKPHDGKITSFNIGRTPSGKGGGSTYSAQIEYEFTYKHENIKGDTFSVSSNTLNIKERNSFPKIYVKNRNIKIYINPNNPQHSSVIKPKLSSLFFNLFLLMVYLTIMGIGAFYGWYDWFYSRNKNKRKRKIWHWWIIYFLLMFSLLFFSIVVDVLG